MAKKRTKELDKGLKVYAIIIGDAGRNQRYITYCPFIKHYKITSETPLAVYLTYSQARKARKIVLNECGHKAVHIIKLEREK